MGKIQSLEVHMILTRVGNTYLKLDDITAVKFTQYHEAIVTLKTGATLMLRDRDSDDLKLLVEQNEVKNVKS